MAAGSALTNMWHRLKLGAALWIVTIIATFVSFIPLFFSTFLDAFTYFLDLIGMFLGPEIAVYLVDYFLIRKGNYKIEEFTKVSGEYWYQGGIHWRAIVAWALGLIMYFALGYVAIIKETIGATFVAMLITAIIYYALAYKNRVK